MQRDEYRIYQQPATTKHSSIFNYPAPQKPEPAPGPLDEYVLSEAEKKILKERRTEAKETFLIHMSRNLKQRLKSASESECVTLNDIINKALREWADAFEKSESRRRGD